MSNIDKLDFDDIKDGRSLSAKKWQLPFGACSLNISPATFYDIMYGETNPSIVHFRSEANQSVEQTSTLHTLNLGVTNYARDVIALSKTSDHTFKSRYKYSVELANPIYDAKSASAYFPLFEGFIKNNKGTDTTMYSLFHDYFNKSWTTSAFIAMCKYYGATVSESKVAGYTILDFYTATKKNVLKEDSDGNQLTGWDIFNQDFSLRFHDKKAIKYPYFENTITSSDQKSFTEMIRYATRFYANSISTLPTPYYIEQLDVSEENEILNLNTDKSGNTTYTSDSIATLLCSSIKAADKTATVNTKASNKLGKIIAARLVDAYDEDTDDVSKVESTNDTLSLVTSEDTTSVSEDAYIYFFDKYDFASNTNAANALTEYGLSTSDTSTWYKFNISDSLIDQALYARNFYMWSQNYFTDLTTCKEGGLLEAIDLNPGMLPHGSTDLNDKAAYTTGANVFPTATGLSSIARFAQTVYDILSMANGETVAHDTLVAYFKNESLLVKMVGFGDLIEPENFNQDLNQESTPVFENLLLNKNNHDSGFSDSTPGKKYFQKTVPLNDSFAITKTEALDLKKSDTKFSTTQIDANVDTAPADMYWRNNKNINYENYLSDGHISAGPSRGNEVLDGKIVGPTIDDIWVFFKRLVEDYSAEALPIFHGVKGTLDTSNTFVHSASASTIYDILDWTPTMDSSTMKYTSMKVNDKILFTKDYQSASMFSFNSPVSTDTSTSGYFISDDFLEPAATRAAALVGHDTTITGGVKALTPSTNITDQRIKAAAAMAETMSFSDNVHERFYKDHPMNLKYIERELQKICQNMYEYTQLVTETYIPKGFGDLNNNVGTLSFLHKNHYSDDSSLVATADGVEKVEDISYDSVSEKDGKVVKTLKIIDADKKVIYDDGIFEDRTLKANFGQTEIPHNQSDATVYTYTEMEKLEANQAKLSEIYLAADGTWRDVNEHPRVPILKCRF